MNKSQPIKNKEKLDRFKNFYIEEEYNPRNYMFISLGLNTALRVSDLLKLHGMMYIILIMAVFALMLN